MGRLQANKRRHTLAIAYASTHTHSHTHADTRTQAHKLFKQSKVEAPLMCFLSKCVWKYTCVLENYPLVNYEGVYGGVYGKVDVEIRHRDAQTDQTLLTV